MALLTVNGITKIDNRIKQNTVGFYSFVTGKTYGSKSARTKAKNDHAKKEFEAGVNKLRQKFAKF